MKRSVIALIIIALCSLVGDKAIADSSCLSSRIHALTKSTVFETVITINWIIEPACDVIETSLLIGTDPNSLAPIGQPIYGYRQSYQQNISVNIEGRYFIAAYAIDEEGGYIQSAPQMILVLLPSPLYDGPHGSHGPLQFYTGTDSDFLQPAGEPHFASLRKAIKTYYSSGTDGLFTSALTSRMIASTHRDEVLTEQGQPLVAGWMSFNVTPYAIDSLNQLDNDFQRLGFPRSGLYDVICDVWILGTWGNPPINGGGPRCLPSLPSWWDNIAVTYREKFEEQYWADGELRGRGTASESSSLVYFIPKPPPDKDVQSAKFYVSARTIGDYTALSLNGKSPTLISPLRCVPDGTYDLCYLSVMWDFTEEVRSIAAQGGGELHLNIDPIPPTDYRPGPGYYYREALVMFASLNVNYPWKHSGGYNSLTIEFKKCNKELKLSATPNTLYPRKSGGITQAIVEVFVNTCPPENGTPPPSVEVTLEIQPPAAGSADAGGHAHNTHRPTGSFERSDGPKKASCIAPIDDNGMGKCSVLYYSNEVSGVETIIGQATDFPDATAPITVMVPGLQPMPESGIGAWRLTGSYGQSGVTSKHIENHYGTPYAKTRIAAMATDYFEETGIAIGINDMSLRYGGLFDIYNNWSTPHIWHRIGISVDIDHSGVNEDRLDKIAEKRYGCKRYEVNLIHYECP